MLICVWWIGGDLVCSILILWKFFFLCLFFLLVLVWWFGWFVICVLILVGFLIGGFMFLLLVFFFWVIWVLLLVFFFGWFCFILLFGRWLFRIMCWCFCLWVWVLCCLLFWFILFMFIDCFGGRCKLVMGIMDDVFFWIYGFSWFEWVWIKVCGEGGLVCCVDVGWFVDCCECCLYF